MVNRVKGSQVRQSKPVKIRPKFFNLFVLRVASAHCTDNSSLNYLFTLFPNFIYFCVFFHPFFLLFFCPLSHFCFIPLLPLLHWRSLNHIRSEELSLTPSITLQRSCTSVTFFSLSWKTFFFCLHDLPSFIHIFFSIFPLPQYYLLHVFSSKATTPTTRHQQFI